MRMEFGSKVVGAMLRLENKAGRLGSLVVEGRPG